MIDKTKIPKYRKRLENLNIMEIYKYFPENHIMDINGWSFPDDREKVFMKIKFDDNEIKKLNEYGLLKLLKKHDNYYQLKRLKTLDIEIAPDKYVDMMNNLKERIDTGEFDKDEKLDKEQVINEFSSLYQKTCTQRCPHCFNQEDDFYINKIINDQKLMKWEETFKYLKEAKKYGLESVKFLGIGEIFKNPDLFNILDDLEREDLLICIFTKGAVFGDDELAMECNYDGILSAEDLVSRLSKYLNVSILLGANSFDPKLQDNMVGCLKSEGIKNYTEKRNKGLQLLVKYGFNNPDYGKRLALIAAPVTPFTSDETIEMYKWAARRNITVVTIPTMVSGKGSGELEWLFGEFENNPFLIDRYDSERRMNREQRYTEWVVDFYTDIYRTAIDNGIKHLDEVMGKWGISGYAGAAYCQQKHNGLYLRLPGTIQECPGRCFGAIVEEDIRKKGLLVSWVGSKNYQRNENCRSLCSVKMKDLSSSNSDMCDCCTVYENVGSMPLELESRVLINIKQIYNML